MVKQLNEMGFNNARATRAIYNTGSNSLEVCFALASHCVTLRGSPLLAPQHAAPLHTPSSQRHGAAPASPVSFSHLSIPCLSQRERQTCVNWIMDHGEDKDIDEPLLVPKKSLVRHLPGVSHRSVALRIAT